MKSNEEEVLELIKFALECNNDTLAIRHIEQYGFFKQGGYKQAESKQLNMHDVSMQSEQLICDTCKSGLIDYPDINRRTCRCGGLGYNVTD